MTLPFVGVCAALSSTCSPKQKGHTMRYVDGFLIPIPKKNAGAYRRLAARAGKIWIEHGALEYRECIGEDLMMKMGLPFPRLLKMKRAETAVFSWIGYSSRAHRDRVNAKVMKDPRIASMIDPSGELFDMKKMCYGGFEVLVDLERKRRAKK